MIVTIDEKNSFRFVVVSIRHLEFSKAIRVVSSFHWLDSLLPSVFSVDFKLQHWDIDHSVKSTSNCARDRLTHRHRRIIDESTSENRKITAKNIVEWWISVAGLIASINSHTIWWRVVCQFLPLFLPSPHCADRRWRQWNISAIYSWSIWHDAAQMRVSTCGGTFSIVDYLSFRPDCRSFLFISAISVIIAFSLFVDEFFFLLSFASVFFGCTYRQRLSALFMAACIVEVTRVRASTQQKIDDKMLRSYCLKMSTVDDISLSFQWFKWFFSTTKKLENIFIVKMIKKSRRKSVTAPMKIVNELVASVKRCFSLERVSFYEKKKNCKRKKIKGKKSE